MGAQDKKNFAFPVGKVELDWQAGGKARRTGRKSKKNWEEILTSLNEFR